MSRSHEVHVWREDLGSRTAAEHWARVSRLYCQVCGVGRSVRWLSVAEADEATAEAVRLSEERNEVRWVPREG